MFSPEAYRALIGWKPVSARIIRAMLATKKKKIRLHVIQCYVPTNEAAGEKKQDFTSNFKWNFTKDVPMTS